MEIKDSGKRTGFDTGAVRDIQEGKGRCDLVPFSSLQRTYMDDEILSYLSFCIEETDMYAIVSALDYYYENEMTYRTKYEMFLDLSIHFENGAKKYDKNNWKKGIPVERYIDSAMRHYIKFKDGQKDENHEIAFVWNLICCMWTIENKPELNTSGKDK